MARAARAPGDVGLHGRDDGGDDARDARREARGAARLSGRRPDRARVTTILLSASGAPGSARLIRALRENGERSVRIVGTDMSDGAIGKHLCDAFHVVPPGSSPDYPDAVLDLVESEHVDLVARQ